MCCLCLAGFTCQTVNRINVVSVLCNAVSGLLFHVGLLVTSANKAVCLEAWLVTLFTIMFGVATSRCLLNDSYASYRPS